MAKYPGRRFDALFHSYHGLAYALAGCVATAGVAAGWPQEDDVFCGAGGVLMDDVVAT